jgi:hypothetical protein
MPKAKSFLEITMAVTRRGDRRKDIRRRSGRRKGDIEKITIQGERDEGSNVVGRDEAVAKKKPSSVWSWYEEFTAELCETFITGRKKGKRKEGK